MNIKEALNSRYIGIWPACAKFNGTNDVVNFGKPDLIQTIGTSDFYLACRFKLLAKPVSTSRGIAGSNTYPADSGTRFGFYIRPDGYVGFSISFGTALKYDTSYTVDLLDGSYHELVMNNDRDGMARFYVDGVLRFERDISTQSAFDFVPAKSFRVGSFSSAADAASLFSNIEVDFISFGKRLLTPLEVSRLDYIRNTTNSFTCYMNGESSLEYDISGNNVNGTWAGTGVRKSYMKDAYPYRLIDGYSLYTKDANPDIQVPYLFNGNPINSPTVPSGYANSGEFLGSNKYINKASCMFNFDPENRTHASIAILDRSNATYQSATSRASSFYDASNVYSYHTSELVDFTTYHSYFNAGYENRFYAKLKKSGATILGIEEMLLYGTNKTDVESNIIKEFCKIS